MSFGAADLGSLADLATGLGLLDASGQPDGQLVLGAGGPG